MEKTKYHGLPQPQHDVPTMLSRQNTLMGRLLCFVGIITFIVVGMGITCIILLANLQTSSDMVARTTDSTVSMRSDMLEMREQLSGWLAGVATEIKPEQLQMSARKVVAIVDNVHQLSGKLARVTPEQIETIVSHTNEIATKFNSALEHIDSAQTQVVVGRVGEIVADLTPAIINRWFTAVSDLASHASIVSNDVEREHLVNKIAATLDTIKSIGTRVEQIHEFTLKI